MQHGSTDGTPVANWTDRFQDSNSGEYVMGLLNQQGNRVGAQADALPDDQKKLLQDTEKRLATMFKEQADKGTPLSQGQMDYMKSKAIDDLYTAGQLGDGIGKANKQYLEIYDYAKQTEANMFLKWGVPLPNDASQTAVNNSPFNANRQQAAQK